MRYLSAYLRSCSALEVGKNSPRMGDLRMALSLPSIAFWAGLLASCGEVADDAPTQDDASSDAAAADADSDGAEAGGDASDAFSVCNAPTPEEACAIPECRQILVRDCWVAHHPYIGQTACACLVGTAFQDCEATDICPPGQRCVGFETMYCHPSFENPPPNCSFIGATAKVCWPE